MHAADTSSVWTQLQCTATGGALTEHLQAQVLPESACNLAAKLLHAACPFQCHLISRGQSWYKSMNKAGTILQALSPVTHSSPGPLHPHLFRLGRARPLRLLLQTRLFVQPQPRTLLPTPPPQPPAFFHDHQPCHPPVLQSMAISPTRGGMQQAKHARPVQHPPTHRVWCLGHVWHVRAPPAAPQPHCRGGST